MAVHSAGQEYTKKKHFIGVLKLQLLAQLGSSN
jgi:hypothetical protein